MDKKKVTQKQINDKLARLIKQEKAEKAKIKHLKVSFMENRFGPLAFALFFAGLGSLLIFKSSALTQSPLASFAPWSPTSVVSSGSTQPPAVIWLVQSAPKAVIGSTITTEVWIDTAGQPVNAVEADLTYPVDKISFTSIDSSQSAFSIQAQADGAHGTVLIARGTVTPVSGKQLIAKVTFKVTAAAGDATISVSESSSALRSSDNINMLATRAGATYSLSY